MTRQGGITGQKRIGLVLGAGVLALGLAAGLSACRGSSAAPAAPAPSSPAPSSPAQPSAPAQPQQTQAQTPEQQFAGDLVGTTDTSTGATVTSATVGAMCSASNLTLAIDEAWEVTDSTAPTTCQQGFTLARKGSSHPRTGIHEPGHLPKY